MQTYDEILQSMTKKYTDYTGIVPDELSDIGIRLRVLAGEIYANAVNIMWLKKQMFFLTAEGEYLDMHATERGMSRRQASKAYGEVTFSVSEAQTERIPVPKGTVVACEQSLLRFETIEEAAIPKGKLSVTVRVQSASSGSAYNVGAGTVNVMVTPPTGVESVTNQYNFSGGCDIESDESLRERIADSVKFPANSTNCAYYESVAEGVEGVSSAGAVPRGRGVGTVDVYIAADGAEADDDTVKRVQALLSQMREVNVDVLVKKSAPSPVSFYITADVKEGYDFDEVKDECIRVLTAFIESRGVGGEVLMCQVSEHLYHIDGVKEFSFIEGVNSDCRCDKTIFPVAGTISITRSSV